MSLRSACVDRARAVFMEEDTTQPWVEGEPWAEQQLGPWFRCRLNVHQPTEGTGIPGVRGVGVRGYHRLEGVGDLIVLTRFEDGSSMTDGEPGLGNFVAFDDGMLLLIESTASPDRIWHVDTGIEPIRKKRKVIGYRVGLRRAREPSVREGHLPTEGSPVPSPLVGVVRERAKRLVAESGPREVGY